VSEAGLRGDESLARLVAWRRARAVRRALALAGDDPTALAVTVGDTVRPITGDAAALPFDNGAFDVVTCHLAAHRFPHAALAVREIHRVLAAGGSFLLAEPLGRDDAEGAAATAERAYRRPEWHAFLRAAGLTVMEEDMLAHEGAPGGRLIVIRAEKD
jgi:SAM-dependent methyltransferase